MSLNLDQRNALSVAERGHNVVIMGSAGTGKSHLVKTMYKGFQDKGIRTSLTCTTGIACAVYPTVMNPMTIHRWSGIGDGRFQSTEIVKVIQNNPKYRSVMERIHSTEVLIVDECSMMSMSLFETLDAVCSMKNKELLFGGMQVILVGDFQQLPPVPNVRYGDSGAFCFQSSLFEKAFPHRVFLKTVVRQSDQRLIKAIDEVSKGFVSAETSHLMATLSRPLQTDDSVKLFSTNERVDDYNRDRILDFVGPLFEYVSSDVGKQKHLSEILAPRKLWLKIDLPVILIRNISDKLVNGLLGFVYELEFGEVIVNFPSVQDNVIVQKMNFEVFDPLTNSVVASREQYPLKPAFGLTIHKSQGMTLESVEVDCRDIFKPGQLGVAMGRVKTLEGLRVVNFTKRACMKQPLEVRKFLSSVSDTEEEPGFSCCKQQKRSFREETVLSSVEIDPLTTGEWDTDFQRNDNMTTEDTEFGVPELMEEFDKEFDDIIIEIDSHECESVHLPEKLDTKGILEGLTYSNVVTPMQLEVNTILARIDINNYEKFCKKEYFFVSSLLNDIKPNTSKGLGEFYSKIHLHNNSLEFKMNCLKLFENEDVFTDSHMHICFNILVAIRKYMIAEKAEEVASSGPNVLPRTITKASRARVRYIGGYCIAKERHKNVMKKNSHRYSQSDSDKTAYEEAKCAINILRNLWEEEQFLLESSEEPESLVDVSRRQNLNRGLTNIPDNLFHFFLQLTEQCLSLLVNENLNKMGSKMFEICQQQILFSSPLYDLFLNIVTKRAETQEMIEEVPVGSGSIQDLLTDMSLQVSEIEKIYKGIIKRFLLVLFNQFRKDFLDNFQVTKKMAHRKQVRVSSGKQTTGTSAVEKSKKKKRRKKDKEDEISDSHEPSDSNEPTEPQPGPSNVRSPEDTEEESGCCSVCQTIEKDSEWIQCDSCDEWQHRSCAGLKNWRKWQKYQKKGSKYHCRNCT